MKKTMVSVLLVLALVLTAAVGAAGETATSSLEELIQGTWEVTDIQGMNSDGSDASAALAMVRAMGGSMKMAFSNGTVTTIMSAMGQESSDSSTYQVSGDQVILQGTTLNCTVNGNEMSLTDGEVTMVLTKTEDAAVSQNENPLIGEWKVTETVTPAENGDESLAAWFKSIRDEGQEIKMTFAEDTVEVAVIGDDEAADKAAYVIEGDTVVIEDGARNLKFFFDEEGRLHLAEDPTETILEPVPSEDVLTGTWEMTGFDGADQDILEMLESGASLTLKFENGLYTLALNGVEMMTSEYTIKDAVTVMINGIDGTFEVDGDTLKLTSEGETMTLVRK